jgi:DNA-binding XRE family transcriptional regulator/quercetin dioxygenase-like cupin family protein
MSDVSVTTDAGDAARQSVPERDVPGRAPGDLAGDIGRRLAAHRGARGMRVAELAREVGVTPSLISQIERGLSRPSVSTLFAIAQALDVPVDAFFREPPQPPASPPGLPPGSPGLPGTPGRGAAGSVGPRAVGQASPAPQATEGRYVVRRGGRAVIDIEGGVRWERLTRSTLDHLDFFELVYEPGAESHPRQYTHPGTEMVLVMTGCLEITIGFERYLLQPGDSIDFPSSMPHRYVNPSSETARAVTAILYDCPGGSGQAPPDARAR